MFLPNRYKYLLSIAIVIFLASCAVKQSIQYDYTYLYDDSQKLIKPSFKVFHQSSDSSTLYFEIKSDDILYGKLGGDTTLTARILCKYILYDAQGKSILDSATVPFFNYNQNAASQLLQSYVKFAVSVGNKLPLEVRFRDEYRDLNVVNYLWVDKRENGNSQYYLLKDNKKVLFEDRIYQQDSVQLYKSSLMPEGTYDIRYANNDFRMAAPPFSREDIIQETTNIDSMHKFVFVDDSLQLFNWAKINEIKPSVGEYDAFYFYHYYEGFPQITDYDQMIDPLRYISTSVEFKRLKDAKDKKKEVDAFWIKMAGSENKAKKMIKEYYRRVILANKEFSTYREGWKSDRGIIYIVYGKPTTIYKSLDREKWIYGEEHNLLSISFEFNRLNHLMGDNYFQMIRKEEYKSNWYRMVDSWRQGKIY